jgi:hypothetical protein
MLIQIMFDSSTSYQIPKLFSRHNVTNVIIYYWDQLYTKHAEQGRCVTAVHTHQHNDDFSNWYFAEIWEDK